jgi:hypothetical protein
MRPVDFPSSSGSRPHRPGSPGSPSSPGSPDTPPASPRPERAASGASPSRETAGAMAPSSLASSSAGAAAPHFEKRTGPAPKIPGLGSLVDTLNVVTVPHREVIAALREGRSHFAGLHHSRQQTKPNDGLLTNSLLTPILRSENACRPGLNAIGCRDEGRMADILRIVSRYSHGQEGHVRFNQGVRGDEHRLAVDAFKHREGGFTLIWVDSALDDMFATDLAKLQAKHSDVIKGMMNIPTHNQLHKEGCRIFAVHTLNAMHDYQPHFQNLHRQIYDHGRGKPAPQLARPPWRRRDGVHLLDDELDNFGLLPGKFFKHMQVMKPRELVPRNLFDFIEARHPALKDQPVNKKGQTLRQRFASQNPQKPIDQFSRFDRTASLDRKRLVLIDRAIAHYEGLARAEGLDSNWTTSVLGKRPRSP